LFCFTFLQSTHSQKLEQGRTRGEYRIFLPDNRWQIVSYVADDDGYRATVRYENGPHDIPRSEQSHWGFATGSLQTPVSGETGSNVPPIYPPRNQFPPQNSGQPPLSKHAFPTQPYQGVVTSQVNTFIVHPTPTDRGRELEDGRKRPEQQRPSNFPGGIEQKPLHRNPPTDPASAPSSSPPLHRNPPKGPASASSSSPPPVYIPQPYAAQQQPRPTTPPPIYTAPRPDTFPDPPVYIPKESTQKFEEQASIIYDPNVYHPFYQPTEKPKTLAAQPIRPFHLPDQFYENRHQHQQVVSNLERPVRPNQIPQQQNEQRPQQEPPPQRYPPTAPPKAENRPPQQLNLRPYLDKPSSNQWTPLYEPAPTRPPYPPYEPQSYQSTPSYPSKPTESPLKPFKASPAYDPVDPYVQQKPQYQPAQPYVPQQRPPYQAPPFYPEQQIKPYEPQQKPAYPAKPAEVYVPQQRPLPTYVDKPSESYEPQQKPVYKPVKPYEPEPPKYVTTPSYPEEPIDQDEPPQKAGYKPINPYEPKPPKYETTPSYPEEPIDQDEPDRKPVTYFTNKPEESYEPQKKPSYQPIPTYPDKPTRPYEPEQLKPQYETTPVYPEKPEEPRKPVTFFSNEPEESYEPQQKPLYRPIPSYPDKPDRPYEPERKPQYEATPSYAERPVEPQKPATFFSNKPDESYEPERKPEEPIDPEEKPAYEPTTFLSDKPLVSYDSEQKPEPAPSYPPQRPQYNEEYRPQYQPRPFANQQPNGYRPPYYPPRPGQPIRPVLKPGYLTPESNYRPEKRPYGVPGYSPATYPPPGIAITSIRPILNPRNQSFVTTTLDESLEGEAPTEPPEWEQEEITTTKKPDAVRKYKVNQPISRKPKYENSPPRFKITRPINNRPVPVSTVQVPVEPETEKPTDQEHSPLLAKYKFKGSTTSNDEYGQRTQPRRKQPSQKETVYDFTVTSLLEEDGPSESIRGYSKIRNENDDSFSVTVLPDEDQISDLESFLPVEEEFYSSNTSDSDVIFFDDGIIPPLLLRVRDKSPPPKIVEDVTVPYALADYQTDIPTTTMIPTEFPSITAPPTEIPSTTRTPTTAYTTTTATPIPSTKAGTRKKKKRVRVKSLKRGNGTLTIMPASKKVQSSVSVLVKEEEKTPVVASKNSTVAAVPRTNSPRIRFPPRVRFVQKTAERVTRQNDKTLADEDLIASDSLNLAVTSQRENDEIGDHAITMEDMMEWSLNSIPIDRLDLVYDSAELEDKPVEE
jgi:hypothetical protein